MPTSAGPDVLAAELVDELLGTHLHAMHEGVDEAVRENVTQAVRDEIDNGAGVKAVHRVVWFVTPNRLAAPDKLGSIYMPYFVGLLPRGE